MKKSYILGTIAVAALSLSSCNDFLNDNRYPLSSQTVNPEFWSNEVNCQNQVNRFLNDFAGYGDRSSTNGSFYYTTLNDDQCGRREFTNWSFTAVPAKSSTFTAPYSEIRAANVVIEGVESSSLTDDKKNNFIGLARLHRARQYFELVKRYGDVPLVKAVLDPESPELYGERTSREEVIDFVVEDLDFAINNISTKKSTTVMSADLAAAIKVEVCLFEGSYAKYHKNDAARANKYFGLAAAAGEAIAASYPICADYSSLYKSFRVAGGGYSPVASNSEAIFVKNYAQGVFCHSLQDYSSASDGVAGITRDAFDSFLGIDGRVCPAGSDKGKIVNDVIDLTDVLAMRDQRLAMTTYPQVMMPGMTYTAANTQAMWSMTGYGVSKYNNLTMTNEDVNTANRNYVCAPIYWGARLYLAIAEAKAELGTITDADLAKYIQPLWNRAGITANATLAWFNGMNDPNRDSDVSAVLWEIRRCRRCELMMDDNIRYFDLVRWHKLDKLDTTTNPKIAQGAYVAFTGVEAASTLGDYLSCTYGMERKFDNKYYFYPIPSDQIALNTNLKQNPGW